MDRWVERLSEQGDRSSLGSTIIGRWVWRVMTVGWSKGNDRQVSGNCDNRQVSRNEDDRNYCNG